MMTPVVIETSFTFHIANFHSKETGKGLENVGGLGE